jgi:hypothetical protein
MPVDIDGRQVLNRGCVYVVIYGGFPGNALRRI